MYKTNCSESKTGLEMANELILIDSIMHEHDAIRRHMKSISGLMDGWEQVDQGTLDEPDSPVIPVVLTGHVNLKQTMSHLDDGLMKHQNHEEEVMPDLLGNPLVEAIRIEHQEIQKQLQEINFILLNVNLRGLLANLEYLKLILGNLCNLVEQNCDIEDSMLKLLKRRFI